MPSNAPYAASSAGDAATTPPTAEHGVAARRSTAPALAQARAALSLLFGNDRQPTKGGRPSAPGHQRALSSGAPAAVGPGGSTTSGNEHSAPAGARPQPKRPLHSQPGKAVAVAWAGEQMASVPPQESRHPSTGGSGKDAVNSQPAAVDSRLFRPVGQKTQRRATTGAVAPAGAPLHEGVRQPLLIPQPALDEYNYQFGSRVAMRQVQRQKHEGRRDHMESK